MEEALTLCHRPEMRQALMEMRDKGTSTHHHGLGCLCPSIKKEPCVVSHAFRGRLSSHSPAFGLVFNKPGLHLLNPTPRVVKGAHVFSSPVSPTGRNSSE